jgi:hypothetical protein
MGETVTRLLPLLMIAALLVAACGGEDELSGDQVIGDRYTTFDDLGVSFAYPEGWERSLDVDRERSTTIRLTSPQGGPFVNVQRIEDPPSFEALLEERASLRESDPDVVSETSAEVEVSGAREARRTVIEISEGAGETGQTITLAVLSEDGDAIFLTAAAAEGSDALDPEAVIDSFRLGG